MSYNSDSASRLIALGLDDRVRSSFADLAADPLAGLLLGRVVRVERGACVVALADADHPARSATASPTAVAVGDWVGVRWHADQLIIETVIARTSELARRDPRGRLQVLASNVDLVFIAAPADRVSAARIERETAMAWDSGGQPVVLLTKVDLAKPDLAKELRQRLLGVDVLATSTVTGAGIDQVAALLRPSRTGVLLGPSGAGKSSLANSLVGTGWLPVGDVRAADRRGRHTTSVRQLLAVPGGGILIDTPGLRGLSLAGGEDGVAATFADIEDLAGECRFSDCRHEREPGCAVTAAVDSGNLDLARLTNYHKLRRELEYQARRDDPVARAEAERVWKIRAKAARQLFRDRENRR